MASALKKSSEVKDNIFSGAGDADDSEHKTASYLDFDEQAIKKRYISIHDVNSALKNLTKNSIDFHITVEVFQDQIEQLHKSFNHSQTAFVDRMKIFNANFQKYMSDNVLGKNEISNNSRSVEIENSVSLGVTSMCNYLEELNGRLSTITDLLKSMELMLEFSRKLMLEQRFTMDTVGKIFTSKVEPGSTNP